MTAQYKIQGKHSLFDEGQLVAASFTTLPRHSNTREENEKIKKRPGKSFVEYSSTQKTPSRY